MAKFVVTYSTPKGNKLSLCYQCNIENPIIRDNQGEEYCQVYKGRHLGTCDMCEKDVAERREDGKDKD